MSSPASGAKPKVSTTSHHTSCLWCFKTKVGFCEVVNFSSCRPSCARRSRTLLTVLFQYGRIFLVLSYAFVSSVPEAGSLRVSHANARLVTLAATLFPLLHALMTQPVGPSHNSDARRKTRTANTTEQHHVIIRAKAM
jgi:hypothetical protein